MIAPMAGIEKVYVYDDADGSPKYETVRYHPKSFRQRQCDSHGGHTWNMDGVERLPFHLPALLERKSKGHTLFVLEGEKDVESSEALGFCATTNAGGSNWQFTPGFVEHFRGAKRIVVIADSDASGRKAALERATVLSAVCNDVRIVDLAPGRIDGFDVSDWLADGGTVEQLKALVESTPPFEIAKPEVRRSLLAVDSTASTSDEWGPLLPIDSIPHPEPLPLGLVPQAYRDFVFDISDRMCVPIEFIAVPQLIATAAVVGRKILIQPEPSNAWKEAPNLWGMLVAEPGMLKSPAQAEAFASIRRLANAQRQVFDSKSTALKERQQLAKLKVEALEQSYKQARKANTETVDIEADLQAQRAILEERAIERRYFTHDATTEKLGEILRDNPQGVLQVRDELSGFFASMERTGREGDRAFYLEAWNGKDPFTVDRIARGTIHIPALCLLNFGTIQPGPLRHFIAEAIQGGSGADGLVQRYGLSVICLAPPPYKKCVRPQDHDARACVDTVFDNLDAIEFTAEGESHVLGFSTAAQPIFDEWRTDLESRIRSDAESSAFRAWLAKQRKTIPALALLFHLIEESGTGRMLSPVSPEALLAACGWGQILESHARHIYGGAVASPAMILATWLKRGRVADGTSVRDLKRRKWSGLTSGPDVDLALEELAELGWLRIEDRATGGRGSSIIRLHPDLGGAP